MCKKEVTMKTNKNSLNNLNKANSVKRKCCHCDREMTLANLKKHQNACKMNPKNMKECPVCQTMHSKGGVTCSYSCSNTYFRSGKNNPNWKENNYRMICFEAHGKACIVCGEDKIVAVHHLNEDHFDNRVENLVPMCPTHHQYFHSKYRDEVMPYINKFIGQ
jgi:hypothetical protein